MIELAGAGMYYGSYKTHNNKKKKIVKESGEGFI